MLMFMFMCVAGRPLDSFRMHPETRQFLFWTILNDMVKCTDGNLDAVFHALADPKRRAVIQMLAQREHSIGELVPSFQISFVAVSNHVKTLERAGLVVREVRGRFHVCKLNAEALNVAYQWLGAYERFWSDRLDALEEVLEEMKTDAGGRRAPASRSKRR